MKITIPQNKEIKKAYAEEEIWYLAHRALNVSYKSLAKYLARNLVLIDKGFRAVLVSKKKKGEVSRSDIEIAALGILALGSLYKGISQKKKINLLEAAVLGVAFSGFLILNSHGGKRRVIPG
ncbi:hypothetical protein [Pedobacter rhizosphaerae]|uniref:Uncharacterized protein n=1 Tax=Pedobacter rhizosphaerae TaxID=390241 RepID=A0A1H9UVU3_9SPHI|nr:hypothetical protein [Pedobacter rhizosphaerae]SES13123.1 hypothetical protein SAMN04488023_13419 [Pedobacter rhizosphaerae]